MRRLSSVLLGLSLIAAPTFAQVSSIPFVAQGPSGCISSNTCTAVTRSVQRLVFTNGCALSTPAGGTGEADLDCSGGGGNVPSTRTLTTTYPLQCGGAQSCDLSANRTISDAVESQLFFVTDPRFAGGAKCDGVTNDAAAVQAAGNAAIDASNALAGRMGWIVFPPCARGGSYRIATSVAWIMTQAMGVSGATHLGIIGYGQDGPIQIAVGAGNVGISAQMALMEWSFLEARNLTFIAANGTYNSSSALIGPVNASHALELVSSSGEVVADNIQFQGLYVSGALLHALTGNHHISNIMDQGDSAQTLIFLDEVFTAQIDKPYSYSEFRNGTQFRDGAGVPLGLIDYAGGQLTYFFQVAPTTSSSPKTQVTINSAQSFTNRNIYMMLVYNLNTPSAVADVINVENSTLTINTAGLYVQNANHVYVKNTQFPLGSKRSIFEAANVVGDVHILSVKSSGLGTVQIDGAGTLEIVDSDLGPDTTSASGITAGGIDDPTLTQVTVRSNGVWSRLRRVDAAVVSNTLVKIGTTDNRVTQLGTGDSATLATGVSLDAATNAGDYVRVVEQLGQVVQVKSDGAGALAPGDPLTSSGASAGRVKKAVSTNPAILRSTSTVAASANALVTTLNTPYPGLVP